MIKKTISIFIAILVVMLPVAFAEQLQIQKFSGVDGVDEFSRNGDELNIEVIADMDGNPTNEVARTRLRLYRKDTYDIFKSCVHSSGTSYKCYYDTEDILYSGKQDYKIKLMDATLQNVVSEIDKSLTADSFAPSILKFDVEPKLTRENTVNVDYSVEDYAISIGDTSVCSGIKEIKFLVDNQEVHKVTGIANQCTKSESFSYKHQMSEDYANVNLCLKAYDNLGQSNIPSCESFRIDNSPPQIKSLELRDTEGYAISHIKSGQEVTADVYVRVEGNDDDVVSVIADLSILNPALGKSNPEEQYGDLYIWRNKKVANPENCEATITAVDEIGNTAKEKISCTLPIDDTAPELLNLKTELVDTDGVYLIGKNGTLILEAREEGSGLDRKHVFLDLSLLGMSVDSQADSCERISEDNWECKWFVNPTVSEGDYEISTRQTSRDDLDNPSVGELSTTLRFDNKAPEIMEEPQVIVEHLYSDYGDMTVKGDVFEIIFTVKDVDKAIVDFTAIGGILGEGTCRGNETKTCEFSQKIEVSGPTMTNLTFVFMDNAGNKVKYEYTLFVFGLSGEESTDYWDYTIDCSPSLIDRSITHLKEVPVYCHISLSSTNPDVMPVYTSGPLDLTECSGPIATYISDVHMMNNGFDSLDPYMVVTLANADFSINELNFSCPVSVSSHFGDSFVQGDEEINIEMNLGFYNLPMGELMENMEEEISDAVDRSLNTMKWIGDVEEYVSWARKICNFKSTITSILSALDGVIGVLTLAASVLTIVKKEDAMNAARVQVCKSKGQVEELLISGHKEKKDYIESGVDLWNYFEAMCDVINCKFTEKETHSKWLASAGDLLGGGGLIGAGTEAITGVNICKDTKNLVSYGLGADYDKIAGKLEKQTGKKKLQPLVDVKESLIWSVTCTCIPGILYNLNKLREIDCKYALCLSQDVKDKGIPASWCKDEKHYLTCKFVVGEIFSITPYAALADKVVNTIKDIFENPIAIIQAVSGCLCGGCPSVVTDTLGATDFCKDKSTEGGWLYISCSISKTIAKIGDAIASIESYDADDWSLEKSDKSWCKQAELAGLGNE